MDGNWFTRLFNYKNIGSKIKGMAKWCCWIAIVSSWISSVIYFFVLIDSRRTEDMAWIPLVSAIVTPFLIWVSSWMSYGFGELVEKVGDIGELVEKLDAIERNTRGAGKHPEDKPTTVTTSAPPVKHLFRCDKCGKMIEAYPCEHCGCEAIGSKKTVVFQETPDVEKQLAVLRKGPKKPCPECGEDLSFMGWDEEELRQKQECPLCGKEIVIKPITVISSDSPSGESDEYYDVECPNCGEELSFQACQVDEESKVTCPECGHKFSLKL